MKSVHILFLLLLVFAALTTASASAATPEVPQVNVLEVDGAVNPTLANYIDRGISQAEKDGAVACIIELDTPGGLLSSTQEITDRILDAKVPVVVYVNRWAGSAGTFITLAAHVAAMAPGSRIGAAHPVSGGGEDISETMDMKVTEDAVADVRSFAQMHGRNVEAAEATVRQALSFSDQEALGKEALSLQYQQILGLESPYLDPPLVDLGADNLTQLLEKLDGREITLQSGETITLHTKDASVNDIKMTSLERFLLAISDPNIAYILLSIAMLGILIELSHPGLIIPGVVGAISLFLSIYSLGLLEANYAGLLLMLLAFGLFVAEVFTAGFGLLFAGGVISLVMGSIILSVGTSFRINAAVIATVVVIFTAIFAFVIFAVIRAHRVPINTGKEGMIGHVAVARTQLDPSGMVFIEGALWTAITEGDKIEPGEEVVVTEVEGLKLKVVKKSK